MLGYLFVTEHKSIQSLFFYKVSVVVLKKKRVNNKIYIYIYIFIILMVFKILARNTF